jgi:hypothetical protein
MTSPVTDVVSFWLVNAIFLSACSGLVGWLRGAHLSLAAYLERPSVLVMTKSSQVTRVFPPLVSPLSALTQCKAFKKPFVVVVVVGRQ